MKSPNWKKKCSDWRITGTLDASRAENSTVRARRADTADLVADAAAGVLALDAPLDGLVGEAGFDFADTSTDSVSSLLTARGLTLVLPAGDVSVTLDTGYNWNRIESEDTRNPGLTTQLTRGDLNGGVALSIHLVTERSWTLTLPAPPPPPLAASPKLPTSMSTAPSMLLRRIATSLPPPGL